MSPASKRQVCLVCSRGLAWPSNRHSSHSRHSDGGGVRDRLLRLRRRSWGQTAHGERSLGVSLQFHSLLLLESTSWLGTSLSSSAWPSSAHKAKPTHFAPLLAGLWPDTGQSCRQMGTWRSMPRIEESVPLGKFQMCWAELVLNADPWTHPSVLNLWLYGSQAGQSRVSISEIPRCCMPRGEHTLLLLLFNEQGGPIACAVQRAGQMRAGPRPLRCQPYPLQPGFRSHSKP